MTDFEEKLHRASQLPLEHRDVGLSLVRNLVGNLFIEKEEKVIIEEADEENDKL